MAVSAHMLPALEHEDVDAVWADGRLVQTAATNYELVDLRIVHSVVGILCAVRKYLPHQHTLKGETNMYMT